MGRSGLYADLLKLCLLTAQRKDKVVSIRREDIKNGAWTIATEAREKPNAGVLDLSPVPPLMLYVVNLAPMVTSSPARGVAISPTGKLAPISIKIVGRCMTFGEQHARS